MTRRHFGLTQTLIPTVPRRRYPWPWPWRVGLAFCVAFFGVVFWAVERWAL